MVYIDQLKPCIPTSIWPYDKACHLMADSLEELHEFAARLGLKRAYFQNHSRLPHYALTVGNHYKALKMGAVLVDHHKVRDLMKAPYQYKNQYSVASSQ